MKNTIGIVAIAVVLISTFAFAGLPQTISYQGYVKNGTTPVNGTVPMTFSLYSSTRPASGAVWSEAQSVNVSNGIYSVQLGAASPNQTISAPFDVPYWLGVNVNNGGELPRQPISSVPYALRAVTADSLSGVKPVALPNNGLTVGTNQLAVTSGGVGINKSNPTAALDVSGNVAVSGNLSFGSATRQMINLFGSGYGLGVQDYTLYFRTDAIGGFAWYKGGTHSNTTNDPGPGGTALMTLDSSGNLNAAGTITTASGVKFPDGSLQTTAKSDCSGGRYEDNGDGTVSDCRTGLVWLKNANCSATSGGIYKLDVLSWDVAVAWAAGLGNGICGLSDGSSAGDWRLPTKTEWMAMVASARKQNFTYPALTNRTGTARWTQGDVFDNIDYGFTFGYWSSSPVAGTSSDAWIIYMLHGAPWPSLKNDVHYVWPVRSGQ